LDRKFARKASNPEDSMSEAEPIKSCSKCGNICLPHVIVCPKCSSVLPEYAPQQSKQFLSGPIEVRKILYFVLAGGSLLAILKLVFKL
jgi:hypothetical protein